MRKTYRRVYSRNIGRALELLGGLEDGEAVARQIAEEVEKQSGLCPVLADDNGYHEYESQELSKYIPEELVEKIQRFAVKNAKKGDPPLYFPGHGSAGPQPEHHAFPGWRSGSVFFHQLWHRYLPEGRMVIECILKAEDAGLGNGETPIFPIHIFKVKEGVNYNPEDPNYDLFKLVCRVSAKRLFPNFSFLDAPFNLQYYKEGDYNSEVAYMGCRTRVMANHYDPTREVTCGRGNLSFTSINPPLAWPLRPTAMWTFSLSNWIGCWIWSVTSSWPDTKSRRPKSPQLPLLNGPGRLAGCR